MSAPVPAVLALVLAPVLVLAGPAPAPAVPTVLEAADPEGLTDPAGPGPGASTETVEVEEGAAEVAAAAAAGEPETAKLDGVVDDAAGSTGHLPDGTVLVERPLVVASSPALSAVRVDGGAAPEDAVVADAADGDRVVTEPVPLDGVQTVGLTWDDVTAAPDVRLRVRVEGDWGEWRELDVDDSAPDPGTADAEHAGLRGGSEPVWLGDDAEAVQLSVPAGASLPVGTSVVLVGSPAVDAAAPEGDGAVSTQAVGTRRVISRAEWGAPAQVCQPNKASTLTHAVLHHTAGSNAYTTTAQAMQQLRNDALYHIRGRGWCDLGYNFVVDKWGNIYEGRGGSSSRAVVGVHAGGFNTGSVGISMLGTFGDVAPSAAVRESVAWVAAWRLGAYHRDPASSVTITTAGGENSKIPPGTTITLPRIFGHRDVANTACPGNQGYATLPGVRTRARALVSPSFVDPVVTSRSIRVGGATTVRASVLGSFAWRAEVRDARTNVLVGTGSGNAAQGGSGVSFRWDATNRDGQDVGPGTYRVRLIAQNAGLGVRAYEGTVEVTGNLPAPPPVAEVPLTPDLTFVPVTPTRLVDTRPAAQSLGAGGRLDVKVTGRAGVPADAKAVALNVTVVSTSTITHLRAWPAGGERPTASVVNADPLRHASAAGVVVGVGGEGKVSLENNAGSAHVVVDVTGYYRAGSGHRYSALGESVRLLDTRKGGGRLSDGATRRVRVAGVGGIPADATSVVVNATSVVARGNGYVAVVPAGASSRSTSTVNHLPGADVANRATVPLSGGALDVAVHGAAADVVLDVVGWYGPGGSSRFTPITPVRAFDTRSSGGALGAGRTRTVQVRSEAGLPSNAAAAVMTLTATRQSAAATYVTAWPAGARRPGTSDLNTGKGRDQANVVVVRLGDGGAVTLYNNLGSTHLVGDVYGYFR